MRKTILLMAVLCCAALCFGALAAEKAATSQFTVLTQDSGKNFSEMNLTPYSALSDFGAVGLNVGEAVKFTAPKPGWKLMGIQILGWSGFNNTTKMFPADRNFLVEVRDKDFNPLYKFADAQNMYFMSSTGPMFSGIDIPAVPVAGDFYVVLYDRGSMGLYMESGTGTGNSFFLINGEMLPAEFKTTRTNETVKVNWLIRAVGK